MPADYRPHQTINHYMILRPVTQDTCLTKIYCVNLFIIKVVMLKKILSSLKKSPALAEELARYDLLVKKEYRQRLMGLILTLAIVPLIFFYYYVNSSTPANQSIIASKSDLLNAYDSNLYQLRDNLHALNIEKINLENSSYGNWRINPQSYLWSQSPILSSNQKIIRIDDSHALYGIPASLLSSKNSEVYGWYGNSTKKDNFVIDQLTGNIYTSSDNADAINLSSGKIEYSINANNLSNSSPSYVANSGDIIEYYLQAINVSDTEQLVKFRIDLSGILDYAILTANNGGASLNEKTNVLSWPDIYSMPGSIETRIFVVKIKSPLPVLALNKQNILEYNCSLDVIYGNLSTTAVACSNIKRFELLYNNLPTVDYSVSYLLLSSYLILVISLFYRTKNIKTSIAKIRHELHQGPLQ